MFNFRIIVFLDGGVVSEVLFGGLAGGEGSEGVVVDVVVGFGAADVIEGDFDVGVGEVALWEAFGGLLDIVEGLRAVFGCFVELETGGGGAAGYVG